MKSLKLSKENRSILIELEKELLLKQEQEKNLINHNTDFAMLEEFVQQCNNNPNLVINVTLADGTKLEIKTTKENKKINPLFTDLAYQE